MNEIIVMIHGMWSGSWVWDNYKIFFEDKGYLCVTPTLRYHESATNEVPDHRLGKVSLLDYVNDLEKLIRKFDSPPILMGHSLGGLLAQILASRGLAKAVILLSPSSPRGIMSLRPSVVKSFWSTLTKWNFWKKPMHQTFNEASYSMLALLPPQDRQKIFNKMVHESGRVGFEIGFWYLDLKQATKVDESKITCPVLIMVGAKDKITPVSVTRNIADKYKSVATYKEFEGHAHWIIGESGWETVAMDALAWLDKALNIEQVPVMPYIEQRNYKRISFQTPVIFSDTGLGIHSQGKALNYSLSGVQFMAETALKQGSDIDLKLVDIAPGFKGPQPNAGYKAEVIWCRRKKDAIYDIGARFYHLDRS
ncbi:MAG: alpha/beta fold hydrolase [Desulfobacteraceae bacterium]|nr:alpha/beta fold hydrolase [Desulfobacteraceae bacterium]